MKNRNKNKDFSEASLWVEKYLGKNKSFKDLIDKILDDDNEDVLKDLLENDEELN